MGRAMGQAAPLLKPPCVPPPLLLLCRERSPAPRLSSCWLACPSPPSACPGAPPRRCGKVTVLALRLPARCSWLTTFAFDNLIYLATALGECAVHAPSRARRPRALPAPASAPAVSIGVTAGLGGTAYSPERHRLAAASALFLLFGPALTGSTYLLHFAFRVAASATGSMLLLNASCVLLITVSFSECHASLPVHVCAALPT